MRGDFLHNDVLLDPFETHFNRLLARVWREYPVGPGRDARHLDLFILYGSHRIAVEAELGPDRVRNDVMKAIAVKATALIIVTPNRPVARRVKRRLQAVNCVPNFSLCAEPLGLALQWVRSSWPLNFDLKVRPKEKAINLRHKLIQLRGNNPCVETSHACQLAEHHRALAHHLGRHAPGQGTQLDLGVPRNHGLSRTRWGSE